MGIWEQPPKYCLKRHGLQVFGSMFGILVKRSELSHASMTGLCLVNTNMHLAELGFRHSSISDARRRSMSVGKDTPSREPRPSHKHLTVHQEYASFGCLYPSHRARISRHLAQYWRNGYMHGSDRCVSPFASFQIIVSLFLSIYMFCWNISKPSFRCTPVRERMSGLQLGTCRIRF